MSTHSRREFMSEVGKGALIAGLGSSLAIEAEIALAFSAKEPTPLSFGSLEPLVGLMEQTPLEKLQPALVDQINRGTQLKTLLAAGALANARCFGGLDHHGLHAMMSLTPAWRIAEELPSEERPLPVLKVLYGNTARIQAAPDGERLHMIAPRTASDSRGNFQRLLRETRDADKHSAERTFAGLARGNPEDAFNDLQPLVQDVPDAHLVTLAWQSWAVLPLTGYQHAQTLLRQSVRYCVERQRERQAAKSPEQSLRRLMPRLLDEYRLLGRPPGSRRAESTWVDRLARTIFNGTQEQAAEAAAAALAEGFAPENIGEALTLAGNSVLLHDAGCPQRCASDAQPQGSVHGDSIGIHASDAANAWRNLARVTNHRNQICSLMVGAWHIAGYRTHAADTPFAFDEEVRRLDPKSVATRPWKSAICKMLRPFAIQQEHMDPASLLAELNGSIQAGDQAKAMAVVECWGHIGRSHCRSGPKYPAKPVFDCLREYAISQDGALHGETYFRTVTEEFATTRIEFRWRHLIGLARVTASAYGWPTPGRSQAKQLLGL